MTEIAAHWKPSEDYFRDFWRDYNRSVNHVRRVQWLLYSGCLIVGTAAFFLPLGAEAKEERLLLRVAFLPGITGIGLLIWRQRKWMRRMMRESDGNAEESVIFSADGVHSKSPDAEARLKWSAIGKVVASSRGLFLRGQTGNWIYIPDGAVAADNWRQTVIGWHDAATRPRRTER